MINVSSFIKDTKSYKNIINDKKCNKLSHAYLLICSDKNLLNEYLKFFAKIFLCKEIEPCMNCRNCRLIDKNINPDVLMFPKNEILSADETNEIIEETYLKPIENNKKVFLIGNGDNISVTSQNKLLKTLEEPPKNIHILIGASNETALLPTVKSRLQKIIIPIFEKDKLFNLLKNEFTDEYKLKQAISCCDGTVGNAISFYNDDKVYICMEFIKDMINNMQQSKSVLDYSFKMLELKISFDYFILVLDLTMRDFLCYYSGKEDLIFNKEFFNLIKNAKGYSLGAVVFIEEKIIEANKRKKFNGNTNMITEWLLFSILEGKHKWQKLLA